MKRMLECMKEIKLRRNINCEIWECILRIGKEEKQSLFHSLALLIRSSDEDLQGTIAGLISRELLDRPSKVEIGKRLLDRFEEMRGVSYENGRVFLTENGKHLARTGISFIPYEDAYQFMISSQDPLLPEQLILNLKEVKMNSRSGRSLHSNVMSMKDKKVERGNKKGHNKLTDVSKFIGSMSDKRHVLFNGNAIKIYSIKPSGKRIGSKSVQLEFQIHKEKDVDVVITSDKEKRKLSLRDIREHLPHLQGVSFASIYSNLLTQTGYEFTEEHQCLVDMDHFQNLNVIEKSSFILKYKLKKPRLVKFGNFEDTKLSLSLIPRNGKVATAWSQFLCIQQINDYISKRQYDEIWDITVRKKEFVGHNCTKLDWEELPSRISRKTSEFWFVQAPQDLSMEVIV